MANNDRHNHKHKNNPSLLIRKLVQLMEHSISKNDTERHLKILLNFLNASRYAFWLQDVSYIIRLYELLSKKIDTIWEFKGPLQCILYFSSVPPLLAKMSNQLEYARDMEDYFSTLGYLIVCLHEEKMKILVLETIKNLLLLDKSPIGWCCVSLEFCIKAIEKSRLPEILANTLLVVNDSIYLHVLQLICLLCELSKNSCKKLVENNAIEYLLQRLEPTWKIRDKSDRPKAPKCEDKIPGFEDTCIILWYLLKSIEKCHVNPPSVFALRSLQYAFYWSIISHEKKSNRNNIAALRLKMLTVFPNLPVVESDIAEDIAIMTVICTEKAVNLEIQPYFQIEKNDLDFYFAKLIWISLYFVAKLEAERITIGGQLVEALTEYVLPKTASHITNTDLNCIGTKLCLRIIPLFLNKFSDTFVKHCKGHLRLVSAIENSDDIELLSAYLKCLYKILLVKNYSLVEHFGIINTPKVVYLTCRKILETYQILTMKLQDCLELSFCILKIFKISEFKLSNKQCLKLILNFLYRVLHPHNDDLLIKPRLTILALQLLWDYLSDKSLQEDFLKEGGAYVVLDVAEFCSFSEKILCLGILADLCKKSAVVPYLITWRKHGIGILPFLMKIFRGNTKKQCYFYQSQPAETIWLKLCKDNQVVFQNCSITKEQLLLSCRQKIHGIITALKMTFRNKVEIVNEQYRLFYQQLQTDDELTMLFAENFLSLKMCEKWVNIAKEIQNEKIVLTDNDISLINEKMLQIHHWKQFLQQQIENIITKENSCYKNQEYSLYRILKDARLSDSLDALKELCYISKCTERIFHISKKLTMTWEIDEHENQIQNFHKTATNFKFFNVYNQQISVESNVIYENKNEDLKIDEISVLNDTETFTYDDFDHSLTEPQCLC